MSLRSDLVVIACRRTTMTWLADVLRDWSALEKIDQVCLIDLDSLRSGDLRIPTTVIDGGTARATQLQQELGSAGRVGRIRVATVTEVGAGVTGADQTEARLLREAIAAVLPSARLVPLHVLALGLQGTPISADLAWLGWHNIVLAPENAPNPESGVMPVVHDPNDPTRLLHFAGGVVSLLGLWAGVPAAPFDDRTLSPGTTFYVARAFSRQLSAEAVESELFARLASVENGYPVPLFQGSSVHVILDEEAAVTEVASELLAKHSYVLRRERAALAPSKKVKISGWSAVKMMFAFLWAAIKNAPMAFIDGAIKKISRGVADRIQASVFGSTEESLYQVVVNGEAANGGAPTMAAIDEAVEALTQRLMQSGVQASTVVQDLTPFWKDFVGAGLTLLDGDPRGSDMQPRMEGSQRAIVTTGRRVVPDPSDTFSPPENIEAYLNEDIEIAPFDAIASRNLEVRMVAVATLQEHLRQQVDAARMKLSAWRMEKDASYTGKVGLRLAHDMAHVRAEIGEIDAKLRSLESAAQVPSEIREQQKRLAKKLRNFLLLALGGIGAFVVATVLGFIGWIILTVGVVVIAAVWFWASFTTFLKGQQEFFHLLNQRQRLAGDLKTLRENLRDALEDLRRLSRAYRQYGDWSQVLGRFVRTPYGRPPARHDSDLLLGTSYPRNHRFGAARPDQVVLDEVSARLRQDMFGVGWLGEAWDLFLRDVPHTMSEAFQVEENPSILFSDPVIARRSLLTAWSEAVIARDDWRGTAEALRTKSDGALERAGALLPRLLAQVESRDSVGAVARVSYAEFVNGLDQVADLDQSRQAFSPALLGGAAVGLVLSVDGAATSVQRYANGLGFTLLVCQTSVGFEATRLIAPGQSPGERGGAVEQDGTSVGDSVYRQQPPVDPSSSPM